jgi:hypothetical protein
MNARLRRFVALLGVAALLFMQFAVSAHACDIADARSSAAVSAAKVAVETADVEASQALLCQLHCTRDQQSADKTELPPVPAVLAADFSSLRPAALGPTDTAPRDVRTRFLVQAPEPPLSIRNCCFRL